MKGNVIPPLCSGFAAEYLPCTGSSGSIHFDLGLKVTQLAPFSAGRYGFTQSFYEVSVFSVLKHFSLECRQKGKFRPLTQRAYRRLNSF